MRRTIFCKHFQSMMDYDQCKAGVAYESLKGIPFDKRPCFARNGEPAPGGCDNAEFPTAEEIAEQDAAIEKQFSNTMRARAAIVAHAGPYEKGVSTNGALPCPVCEGKGELSYSRAGYNGHVHARCSTENCVAWME